MGVQKSQQPILTDELLTGVVILTGRSMRPPPSGMGAIGFDGTDYYAWDGDAFHKLTLGTQTPPPKANPDHIHVSEMGLPTSLFQVETNGDQTPWRPTTADNWIGITDPLVDTVGDSSVTFSVEAQQQGNRPARTGHIDITALGLHFVVTQEASMAVATEGEPEPPILAPETKPAKTDEPKEGVWKNEPHPQAPHKTKHEPPAHNPPHRKS